MRDIVRRSALICDHLLLGRKQTELIANLRSVIVRRYLIFYQPFENGVEVLRVLHGSRDVERIFDDWLDALGP